MPMKLGKGFGFHMTGPTLQQRNDHITLAALNSRIRLDLGEENVYVCMSTPEQRGFSGSFAPHFRLNGVQVNLPLVVFAKKSTDKRG